MSGTAHPGRTSSAPAGRARGPSPWLLLAREADAQRRMLRAGSRQQPRRSQSPTTPSPTSVLPFKAYPTPMSPLRSTVRNFKGPAFFPEQSPTASEMGLGDDKKTDAGSGGLASPTPSKASSAVRRAASAPPVESDVVIAERAAIPGAPLIYGCVIALQSITSGGFLQMVVDTFKPDNAWSSGASSVAGSAGVELDGMMSWCEATAPNPLVAHLKGLLGSASPARPQQYDSDVASVLGSDNGELEGAITSRRKSLSAVPLHERVTRCNFFRIVNANNPSDRGEVKSGDAVALEVLIYDTVSTRWGIGARVLLEHQNDPRYAKVRGPVVKLPYAHYFQP
jgi:hypothetical protein